MERKIHIGTSGWHYKHWMGNFYPPEVKSKGFTDYYIRFFRTVEINNSFYKLPSFETFANWRAAVPDDFIFAVKASRYITHMKKLKEPQEGLSRLFNNINALEEKLGPILFQLPPMWKLNLERLRDLLRLLPPYYRYTFEFRHHSWYTPEVLELLRQHNAAFCVYEWNIISRHWRLRLILRMCACTGLKASTPAATAKAPCSGGQTSAGPGSRLA